jgi:hypothetical protein
MARAGWGKPSSLPSDVDAAVRNGATRAVTVGNLPDALLAEENLRALLVRFGPLDQVKLSPETRTAVVHFIFINAAIQCVNTLPTEEAYRTLTVQFAKVRAEAHTLTGAQSTLTHTCVCVCVCPGGGRQDRCNRPSRDAPADGHYVAMPPPSMPAALSGPMVRGATRGQGGDGARAPV